MSEVGKGREDEIGWDQMGGLSYLLESFQF